MAALVDQAAAGDFAAARATHERLLPLMQVNFVESNPIPVKAAMAELGLLDLNYRLPLTPPAAAAHARIVDVLAATGLSGAGSPPARQRQASLAGT
jgi:4-hydroxy-tetrahydrodipicolinate synthase